MQPLYPVGALDKFEAPHFSFFHSTHVLSFCFVDSFRCGDGCFNIVVFSG